MNNLKKESFRQRRRTVVDNAKNKRGEYGVVDKLFESDKKDVHGKILKKALDDPATKKLEIKNNPMEQIELPPKFMDRQMSSTNFKVQFIQKLHKNESAGWNFIEHHEKTSLWRESKSMLE